MHGAGRASSTALHATAFARSRAPCDGHLVGTTVLVAEGLVAEGLAAKGLVAEGLVVEGARDRLL